MSASPDRVWKFSGQIAWKWIDNPKKNDPLVTWRGLFCQLLVAEQFLADRTGLLDSMEGQHFRTFSYLFVASPPPGLSRWPWCSPALQVCLASCTSPVMLAYSMHSLQEIAQKTELTSGWQPKRDLHRLPRDGPIEREQPPEKVIQQWHNQLILCWRSKGNGQLPTFKVT